MLDTAQPGSTGRAAIKESLAKDIWQSNERFTAELTETIKNHRLSSHPLKEILQIESGDVGLAKVLHLEFRHAFAQIFTDSIAHAMVTAGQLEGRLGAVGKVAARFLLQLNLLDELGFVPAASGAKEYAGHPHLAHYLQFSNTLAQLGLSKADIAAYVPSSACCAARATFEDQYGDHKLLVTVLAAAETTFADFAGPWAKNTSSSTKIDVKQGYHAIHVEQGDGAFIDDDHSEDSWYLVRQAIEPDDHELIATHLAAWLDTWAAFADQLTATVMAHTSKGA